MSSVTSNRSTVAEAKTPDDRVISGDQVVSPGAGAEALARAAYRRRVSRLQAQYAAIPPGAPVRLAKRTSNLFRPRSRTDTPGLDVSSFDGVIAIDPDAATAEVGGMITYESLVDATLPHGLMPKVVPELKTITVGGALTGLGIESSSWRNGMPHESVLEFDVLTGDGRIVTATPEGQHSDLFYGFPNSYGTLGYALRVKLALEEVHPFVHLRHLRFSSIEELTPTLVEVCDSGVYDTEPVAFVDGVVFSAGECYLTLGSWANEAPFTSDYTHMDIYYRSLQERREDWLTVRDYIWRWDTDWFWCSGAFMAQRPLVRRLLGAKRLRSNNYWKVMAFEERYRPMATLDRIKGKPPRENVIQDIEVKVDRLVEFVNDFLAEVPILPFWLCPLRPTGKHWDLYQMDPDALYVNVGFWSSVELATGMDPAHHNRWVEEEVERLGGRKSLYSTAFYSRERFWEMYNGVVYDRLKGRYDPDRRLHDLYDKCVRGR